MAFDALEELDWELGGTTDASRYLLTDADGTIGVVYDEGFDDNGEIEGDDHDAGGDGSEMGRQRLASRSLTIGISTAPSATDAEMAATMQSLRLVTAPLPDRYRGLYIARWRRLGEVAKRVYYRPALGKTLEIPGDEARLKYNGAAVAIHLEAPLPYVLSDALHSATFTAGETKVITNAGSICVPAPALWTVSAATGVTISHEDYAGESITFPSSGAVTVTREAGTQRPEIIGVGTYGKCNGPAGVLFPRWPLLRPGDNNITASAACTITWRDTW